ncbi:hypothetical protein GCM10010201_05360 [Pilimelia columellifera subsp. columellifera]|uniref:Integrase catalytic domain-containing protein n=1 Tax=Pilimelia columellifera subsp. columellifera TaxID=706583 RepID=A0ABP6ACG2_9ACTN
MISIRRGCWASHRGVERAQYISKAFAAACETAGVRQSMSAVGNSADNALTESFNATFKRETPQGRRAFADPPATLAAAA